MPELTVEQVLHLIDVPVDPRAEFRSSLLTSLIEELERLPDAEPVPVPVPVRAGRRLQIPFRMPEPRPWARVAVAAAAAIALALALVIVRLPSGTNDALAVMREARAKFAALPPFQATTMQRIPGAWLRGEIDGLDAPIPDVVFERDIAYLDATHFRNLVTGSSWGGGGTRAAVAAIEASNPRAGEYWAADGEYFAHYLPSPSSFTVMPVQDEQSLAYFAAGMLDPNVEAMADPSDAYIAAHCEVLPDETMLGRTVHHLHCTDPAFRQHEGGPTLDLDTYIDEETGMLLKMASRNEGVWFEATSVDLAPGFTAEDFALSVPEGAAITWTGGGVPPERFRQEVDPSVTSIPVGTAPGSIVGGAGAIWVTYTEGGEGSEGVGGRQMVARIDPATNEVVARIEVPTELTELPKHWSSPLVFVGNLTPTDDGVFISYEDAGNETPERIARIDPETNTLDPPIMTLGTLGTLAGLGFADGSLWVCDAEGGRTVDLPPGASPWHYSALLRVDPATGDVVTRIPVEGSAGGEMFSADGFLWLPAYTARGNDPQGEKVLFKVDLATEQVVSTVPIPHSSSSIASGDGTIWIRDPLLGKLFPLDPKTGRIGEGISIGRSDGGVTVGAGLVWATNAGDNTLMAIDPTTGEIVSKILIGGSPWSLTVAQGGVWVANYADGTVSRVDAPG